MPTTNARALPTSSERRWSLAAAIASVTVFGLGIGQSAPLLSLSLELRGTKATLPLFGVGDAARSFGREPGAGPLTMFARAPLIVVAVAVFGLYEAALMALLPIWGLRTGLNERTAAATLSTVYIGSIVLQMLI